MALVLAMVLDAILGEPKWLWDHFPHPAVLMGRCVSALDQKLNDRTRQKGIAAVLVLLIAALAIGYLLQSLPGIWVEVVLGAILLAQRSLVDHVKAVADALRLSVDDGRSAVAMIVGRDVRDMDEPAIARSAIESAAENLSDGVIAPVFWFAVAGLPGLLAYKIINTADSMIGYRTEKYEAFGWAAARLDDVLNWIPARITALLLWAVAPNRPTWAAIRRDAALHRSPNAGWPEAAIAPALGVSLSGPRSYEGVIQDFPWVNPVGSKDAGADDIDGAIALLWKAWALALLVIAVIAATPLLAWFAGSALAA
ncbi:adenosylcobinamide-phosphate synthase CbiB [Octadecabacter sp. 1_MG-2023]|uniref:adenosylcobinamide-phosphate synthase CbiB n=1 Tax=unclassified Octadecabacter TaxID=196158 RepID=UPI001C0A468C|nr:MULTISPECIES: adenosylcobinamide-phosphate synthase CbiB [unclassified Octadecabacter]MBU2992580.1 adenosylcobinamide-phosphate synthase CbiB [Octadecabacter sp. B2R22]MDO6734663.1 adenosylcobinamide-phosphate synthase CbiB [Octadecabacter sp. 1_MG-2023]